MNRHNKMVLEKCCEDLKRIKHLLSAISNDEDVELRGIEKNTALTSTQKWRKRERINQNTYDLQGSITGIYKVVGQLMKVH